jgi:hypothetical protein
LRVQDELRPELTGWARHRLERRATYETLTYETYRRLLLDAGAPPIAPSTRGTVRARRLDTAFRLPVLLMHCSCTGPERCPGS